MASLLMVRCVVVVLELMTPPSQMHGAGHQWLKSSAQISIRALMHLVGFLFSRKFSPTSSLMHASTPIMVCHLEQQPITGVPDGLASYRRECYNLPHFKQLHPFQIFPKVYNWILWICEVRYFHDVFDIDVSCCELCVSHVWDALSTWNKKYWMLG